MRFFRKEGKPALTSVEVRGTSVTVGKKYRFGLPGDGSPEQEGFYIQGRVQSINEWRSRMNSTDVRHNVTLARLGRKTNSAFRGLRHLDTRDDISTVTEIEK